jgi:hypothetical protein
MMVARVLFVFNHKRDRRRRAQLIRVLSRLFTCHPATSADHEGLDGQNASTILCSSIVHLSGTIVALRRKWTRRVPCGHFRGGLGWGMMTVRPCDPSCFLDRVLEKGKHAASDRAM